MSVLTYQPSLAVQVDNRGYAVLADEFRADEIARLLTGLNASSSARSKAGVRHLLHDPLIAEFANDERFLCIAKSVLGGAAVPFRATLFDKSPEANWLVVWHQDTALPLKERRDVIGWGPWSIKDGIHYAHAPAPALERVLAIRVHLDDSTADNGPLRVLPGTHHYGLLSDDAIHDLSCSVEPVECLVGAGGLVLMKPLLVHASSKSKSAVSRRVLHMEYATGLELCDGLELTKA